MKKVERNEILDYETYDEQREAIRAQVLRVKEDRRIHVGEYLTFLFENADTMRYQIQEMMRVERIVKESAIEHELTTYNEVLGGAGELGCTLLIEIDNPEERARRLGEWVGLQDHLYLELEDGSRVRPQYDSRQVGEDRLSSVQYLKFRVGEGTPVGIGSDFPSLRIDAKLTVKQRQALLEDLND